ncbi:MAG: hypothetical protein R3C32_05730 [Chloroflexota bacterium]
MRRIALAIAAGLMLVATTVLAADDDSGGVVAPLMDGQALADALMEWDGYDFTDAGDIWPGALRSGPSSLSDPNDAFGGDGTIWILPSLDEPAHVLVEARLSEMSNASIWGNYQRIMEELGLTEEEQQGVYGALGEVLGAGYAAASDDEQASQADAWFAGGVALWQVQTRGFEPVAEGQPAPLVPMPDGGVTLEIVPDGQESAVLPMPEPTPTPTIEPTPTPRKTPKPTPKPTATPAFTQAPAPKHWVCDGSDTIIPDPLLKGWNIQRVNWGKRNGYDRITVTLNRYNALGGNGAQAITHVLESDQVSPTLKVKKPKDGEWSIALGLFQDVRLTWTLDRELSGLGAVESITLGKDNNGYPWLVVGTDEVPPCYQLQVPAWTASNPKTQQSIQVFLDVKS